MSGAAAQSVETDISESRVWRRIGLAFCVAMVALHVAAALHSAGVTDFWRDVYWATVIAHGEHFMLSGPPINNFVELGPWWFYLLAGPIALTGRVTAAAVTVQLLAAMKYPLALRLGTRLVDARFGFLFAASLAVAGWSTAAFWFPSHPALIETTLLLLAFAMWRCVRNFSIGNAALFGLAAAACIHAHPATLMYLVVGGLVLLWRQRSLRGVALLAIAMLVVLASLAPPWFDTSPAWPNLPTTLSSWAQDDIGVDFLHRWFRLVYAVFCGGASIGFLLMTRWSLSGADFAWWLYCAGLAMAFAGAALAGTQHKRMRIIFAMAIAALLLQTAFLVFVRHFTPIWMLPSCLPPLALALAVGWHGWISAAERTRRIAGMLGAAIFIGLSLAPFGYFLRDVHSARIMNANPLFDAGDIGDRYSTRPVFPMSVREVDSLATALCAPATLHLSLAATIEGTSASALRNACGRWPDVVFAGQAPGAHVAGLPVRLARAAGITPDLVVAGMALYSRVRVIAPAQGAKIAGLRRMELGHRPADASTPVRLVYNFDADVGDVVALTNLYPTFQPLSVRAAEIDGKPAQALFADGRMFVYRCVDCARDALAHWHLDLDGVAANLDLVVLPANGVPAEAH